MTSVSVVIPTYNRWSRLESALGALAAQTVPREHVEIIVVSDGSTDGTDERLEDGRAPVPVTLVKQQNQGPAAARNAGVEAADGDIVVFIDDDVVADPECLASHLRAHRSSGPGTVVIGPLLTPEDFSMEPWVRWEQAMLYKQYDAMARGDWAATARQFYTGNASLERSCFLASGGFDSSFRRAEDVELAYRLEDSGMRFVFAFEARAFHYASRSFDSWLDNASAYGTNDVVFWRDRGQEWLVPAIRAEYELRHPLTRGFTRAGLAVPAIGRAAIWLASRFTPRDDRAVMERLGRRLLSSVYNLSYYQALVEELGGFTTFRSIEPALTGPSRPAPTSTQRGLS